MIPTSRRDPMERFMEKVEQRPDGCWLWTAALHEEGYGKFRYGTLMVRAHRWLYEQIVGPIPDGLCLDHLCRVRHCVNPAHLEPVTNRENCRRGVGWAGTKARQTRCKHGHPLDGENLYVTPDGRRKCRTCHRESRRRRAEMVA